MGAADKPERRATCGEKRGGCGVELQTHRAGIREQLSCQRLTDLAGKEWVDGGMDLPRCGAHEQELGRSDAIVEPMRGLVEAVQVPGAEAMEPGA